jgi:hypothetical protein
MIAFSIRISFLSTLFVLPIVIVSPEVRNNVSYGSQYKRVNDYYNCSRNARDTENGYMANE